jgi:hypothetical protein
MRAAVLPICKAGILFLVVITFLMGTVGTLRAIPDAQAASNQQDALVRDLLRIHATRTYSDYWTCARLMFASDERIICSSLRSWLESSHTLDRYPPYYAIVRANPHPVYVFPLGSPQAVHMASLVRYLDARYQRQIFDGYVVYQFGT